MADASQVERNLTPYGPKSQVPYADPGYQADKKARYPIDSKVHAKAAWSYINQQRNAAKYTPNQLKRIKGRIKAALTKFGVTAGSEGWSYEPAFQVTESLLEYMGGDPSRSGSWCVSASNGPVNLSLSSYSMDPADLDVILRAAADAACKALAALDPDMDGDIDVAGARGEDTDHDGGHENAPPQTTAPATGAADGPAAAPGHTEGTEDPAMGEAATTQAAGNTPATNPPGPGLTLEAMQKAAADAASTAVASALAARDKADAKKRRKQEKQEKRQRRASETDASASGKGKNGPKETAEQRIERLANERAIALMQEAVADGTVTVNRTGVTAPVAEHRAPVAGAEGALAVAEPPQPLEQMDEDSLLDYAGAALDQATFGHRVDQGRPAAVTAWPPQN